MVIAIDIRPLLESEQTGVSVYTKELIDELVKNKNHQFILFYNSWGKEINDVWQQSNVVVRRFRSPNKLLNIVETLFSEPSFDELISEADYFLFPNLNFFNVRQKPYGVVIHDISFERIPEFFNLKSRLWHQAINVQEKLDAARDIFAVSGYTAGDVADFYKISQEKITVAHPGITINPKSDQSSVTLVKEEIRNPKQVFDSPYFLFLGRVEERKNVFAVIKAFIQLKEHEKCSAYQLILAGPLAQGTEYGRKISMLINGRTDIQLTGFKTVDEKNNLLAHAAALVYPSFYEGFGFPPLEAQALGVPVIASNVSSLPEIIGNSGLLVDPDRNDEIARAMEEVVTNEQTRKLLIIRGLENVKRFSWSKTANTILNSILKN